MRTGLVGLALVWLVAVPAAGGDASPPVTQESFSNSRRTDVRFPGPVRSFTVVQGDDGPAVLVLTARLPVVPEKLEEDETLKTLLQTIPVLQAIFQAQLNVIQEHQIKTDPIKTTYPLCKDNREELLKNNDRKKYQEKSMGLKIEMVDPNL